MLRNFVIIWYLPHALLEGHPSSSVLLRRASLHRPPLPGHRRQRPHRQVLPHQQRRQEAWKPG